MPGAVGSLQCRSAAVPAGSRAAARIVLRDSAGRVAGSAALRGTCRAAPDRAPAARRRTARPPALVNSTTSGCCGCRNARDLLLLVGVDLGERESAAVVVRDALEQRHQCPAGPHQGAQKSTSTGRFAARRRPWEISWLRNLYGVLMRRRMAGFASRDACKPRRSARPSFCPAASPVWLYSRRNLDLPQCGKESTRWSSTSTHRCWDCGLLAACLPAHADWSGKAELGGSFATGNSDNESANAAAVVKYIRGTWSDEFGFSGNYGSSGGDDHGPALGGPRTVELRLHAEGLLVRRRPLRRRPLQCLRLPGIARDRSWLQVRQHGQDQVLGAGRPGLSSFQGARDR